MERSEAALVRHGGADPTLRHGEIVKLKDKVDEVQSQVESLKRELGGFLNLPPSIEMARVEVAGKKQELDKLDKEVESKISSLHVWLSVTDDQLMIVENEILSRRSR